MSESADVGNLEVAPEAPSLEEIKNQISNVGLKALETHSREFEEIHEALSQVLTEIDGI